MKKRHITEDELFFYATDDLDLENKKRIEKHLQECGFCRDRIKNDEYFYNAIRDLEYPLPNKKILEKCRQRLHKNLEEISQQDNEKSFSLLKSIRSFFPPGYALKFAAGAVLFLFGLVAGLHISSPEKQSIGDILGSSSVSLQNISLSFDQEGREKVEFTIQRDKREKVQVSSNDPELIKEAIKILRSDARDGIRLKAIKILKNADMKKVVEKALIESLTTDSNPGIRLKAIRILKKFPINKEIKQVLISVLFREPNSGIRYEAEQRLKEFKEIDSITSMINRKNL